MDEPTPDEQRERAHIMATVKRDAWRELIGLCSRVLDYGDQPTAWPSGYDIQQANAALVRLVSRDAWELRRG